MDPGWLKELDDQLTCTDACDIARRFCQSLEHREVSATASPLCIVQDAVSQLAIDLSPNLQERMREFSTRCGANGRLLPC